MSGAVVAGIGCRAGCPAEDIVGLVRRAAEEAGRAVSFLAAPEFKAQEEGLRQAALRLALPLRLIDRYRLAAAQARCPTRSPAAERAVAVGSVAEGAALAAAGDGGRLLLPRIAGPRATCALAETV